MFGDDALDLVRGTDRNRRLHDDNGEVLDHLGDRPRRVVNIMHVGRTDFGERRRSDGDEDRSRPASGRLQTWW